MVSLRFRVVFGAPAGVALAYAPGRLGLAAGGRREHGRPNGMVERAQAASVGRSDEELMAAYVAGDAAAFRALFERYGGPLYALVRRRVRADDDARDLVQQTFLQLHRARADFRSDARLRPWLFTIAFNLVREHYRRSGRRREEVVAPELIDPLAATAGVAESPGSGAIPLAAPEQIARHERLARVRAALASLPDAQREVIELHWFEECPYDEIAAVVGASVEAVRVRAHRGYARLRVLLPGEAE
jgi:RNA polymerase sigma-70 factor (ECF subfamily)